LAVGEQGQRLLDRENLERSAGLQSRAEGNSKEEVFGRPGHPLAAEAADQMAGFLLEAGSNA
jgi:hypothetical protein